MAPCLSDKTMKKITNQELSKIFNIKMPVSLKKDIAKEKLFYKKVSDLEKDLLTIKVIKELQDKKLKISGPHRIKDWESGWNIVACC